MSQTVLVADDSKTIRQIVEMALKASSWEVVGVGSAQDAMQAARQNPSVILLDYYMPDGSGYDVCRQLKAEAATRAIPVVMLGGTYKSFDEGLARQSGADAVLMKPFKTDALLSAMEEAKLNGASAPLPVPQPAFEEEESEPSYGYAAEPSEPAEVAEPAYNQGYAAQADSEPYQLAEPSSEPSYAAPEPAFPPPRRPAATEAPRYPAGDATPMPTSQPRIPNDPPRHHSTPGHSIEPRSVAPAPATGGVGPAMNRSEIESLIKEQVKATVRDELPGLLRTVMSEIFQTKVLPKLLEHANQRVQSAVAENLSGQIQNQVRLELERLLNEE